MKPDLTVSIISANNLELLLPCMRSVFERTHQVNLQVFVVDNASDDGTAEIVARQFPQVEVIQNSTRQGFSTNNNLVLARGTGRYQILLNDDTLVLDGALDAMVAFMDTHPQAGAVGAFLLNGDGTFQPAFSRFPHPIVEAILPATNWSYRMARQATRPVEVDSVCGAAMMVRQEVIDQVGPLDTSFDPIYSEEVDWCFRIRQAGWPIFMLPEARVIHFGSQTMNRVVPRKYELLLSHKALFFRKHNGPWAANLYRLFLSFSTAAKLIWWMLAVALSRDQRTSRERVRLHWHLLRRIPAL